MINKMINRSKLIKTLYNQFCNLIISWCAIFKNNSTEAFLEGLHSVRKVTKYRKSRIKYKKS